MARISDLMVEAGRVKADGIRARGAAWGTVASALGSLPGQIGHLRQQQQERDQQQAVQQSQLATGELQRENIRSEMTARTQDQQAQEQGRKLAEHTRVVSEWLTAAASATDPAEQARIYAEGRQRLRTMGVLDEAETPAQFVPGWVKARLAQTLPALERFKQLYPEVVAPKTREVKTRNADGSESIAIVEDRPGQNFTSAAEPVKDFEWVTRNGQAVQVPKGTAQQGDRPYQPPSQAQPREPQFEWVTRNGQPVQIPKGSAQPGDAPYDATAQRGVSDRALASDKQASRATEGIALVDSLVKFDANGNATTKHPGFNAAFGSVQAHIPTFRQATADAKAIVNRLVSLVTQPEMQALRGLGPASDRDMAIIQNGATTLSNPAISEAAAQQELQRIRGAFERLQKLTVPATADAPAQRVNPFRR